MAYLPDFVYNKKMEGGDPDMLRSWLPGLGGGLLKALILGLGGGILSFCAGQALPRKWFSSEAFPFRPFVWEQGGRCYERLGVRRWKDVLPDMSRLVPGMVKKKAALNRTPEAMDRLVRETCVAEAVHWALILCMTPLLAYAVPGPLGALIALGYALGNLLFVIIQRYNRPRLVEIRKRLEMRRKNDFD